MSPETIQWVAKVFARAASLNSVPYRWDPHQLKFIVIPRKGFRYFLQILSLSFYTWDLLKHLVLLLLMLLGEDLIPKDTIVRKAFEVWLKFFLCTLHQLILLDRHAVARHINLFIKFHVNFDESGTKCVCTYEIIRSFR